MIQPIKLLSAILLLFHFTASFADQNKAISDGQYSSNNVVIERQQEEKQALGNNFAITLYKQNFILPFYYTGSPYNAVYVNETPNGEKLNQDEVKFQLSFKTPLWTNLFNTPTNLYFGYTQLSYWQLYNKSAFFRSTDYEPEFFTQTKINMPLGHNWYFNAFTVGAVHQSNGFGNQMERSWNRIYIGTSFSNDYFLINIRPWFVFHDSTYEKYNPDLTNYLGYGEFIVAYKLNKQIITLQLHSLIEYGGRYATGTFTYSFPITEYINGFAEIFSGYGQSLIEYNHRTNSFGIGFALNNLI